ncbi:hypothetical protein [Stenotrophomonas sp. SY1]|uniref:hypothetical protein n=1 Tax=Stenotrophomonas sp. SY1 TaxID=477235 RepID=UPI001E6286B5|nr:hypothetical protein [Stenotrophomonas sp. SY1]MCD9085429.1 hypothetical protein [Stenotrophomonas sp. SY1]
MNWTGVAEARIDQREGCKRGEPAHRVPAAFTPAERTAPKYVPGRDDGSRSFAAGKLSHQTIDGRCDASSFN